MTVNKFSSINCNVPVIKISRIQPFFLLPPMEVNLFTRKPRNSGASKAFSEAVHDTHANQSKSCPTLCLHTNFGLLNKIAQRTLTLKIIA